MRKKEYDVIGPGKRERTGHVLGDLGEEEDGDHNSPALLMRVTERD